MNYHLLDLIGVFDNVVPKETCDELIKWFHDNEDRHVEGGIYGGDNLINDVDPDFKIARQIFPVPSDHVSDIITNIVFSSFNFYHDHFPAPAGHLLCAKDYSVRIYPKGVGQFKEHIDQSAGGTVTRVFAIIVYLNNVENGGETEFPYLDMKVSPKQGRVLIFPCNYLYPHKGNMPISDDKYIITSFINFTNNVTQS